MQVILGGLRKSILSQDIDWLSKIRKKEEFYSFKNKNLLKIKSKIFLIWHFKKKKEGGGCEIRKLIA